MKSIRHLIWKLFGTPELPPRNFKLMPKINVYTGKEYTPRYYTLTRIYNSGVEIDKIASAFNLTRERVRQCIWKAYRENEMSDGT